MGKVSPVHFFWGSFDLAVTRFSGRPAPPREGADAITREAYSHEVISAGFWPGNGGFGEAAFYCYAAPAPKGLENAAIQPAKAGYNKTWVNSFTCTRISSTSLRRMRPCSPSCRAPMKRGPRLPSGIAVCWSGNPP